MNAPKVDVNPDKPLSGGLGSNIEQKKKLPETPPASFDFGSPHATGSMKQRAQDMQVIRLECLERTVIGRFLNMSWKPNDKQN